MWTDARELRGDAAYRLLIDTVVPRPVAWISTWTDDGLPHLAPFSFFSGVSARPPTISVAIASKPVLDAGGVRGFGPKDTLRFLRRRRAFVVHIASRDHAALVDRSAVDHPDGTDVFAMLGFTAVPALRVDAPRIESLPVALECEPVREVEHGTPVTTLVLAEVRGWHLPDPWVDQEGRLRWPPEHEALARLGVQGYR